MLQKSICFKNNVFNLCRSDKLIPCFIQIQKKKYEKNFKIMSNSRLFWSDLYERLDDDNRHTNFLNIPSKIRITIKIELLNLNFITYIFRVAPMRPRSKLSTLFFHYFHTVFGYCQDHEGDESHSIDLQWF